MNVDNITGFIGLAPRILLDTAFGDSSIQRNAPSQIQSADELFLGEPPVLKSGSCGRLAETTLTDAFQELKQLYLRIARERNFLLSEESEVDANRSVALLRDLSAMTKNFRHMQGIAAKSASLVARKRGQSGVKLTPIMSVIDDLLETQEVTDNLLSADFGRLLQARGLSILQERIDLPAQLRLDRSFAVLEQAVFYNSGQSEAWMNLSIVAFKRGDCAAASRYAHSAAATLSTEENRESTEFFASKMEEFSRDPKTCKAAGENFNPYPGL